MALTLKDRVLETAAAPGTGAVTLLGAVTGYQTFSAAIGNGNICYYTIADQSGANWEVGIGTYSSSGNTLARTTILSSSNAGSTVNFASGTQNVFVTYPSEKAVYLDASGNVQPSLGTATFSSITDSGLTSGRVTYAGTSGLLQDSSNLTFNGTTLTANTLNLTNALGVAYGGTGLTTLTSGYIPYGNGTSAFSSSANLYFDGTNLSVGNNPLSFGGGYANFTVSGSSGGALYVTNTANTGQGFFGVNSSALQFGSQTNIPIAFYANNSEKMRLTSAGYLGIGTSSPSYQLDVRGTANVQSTTTAQLFLQSNSGGYASSINVGGTGNGLGYTSGELYFQNTNNAIVFANKASAGESMRITSAGYLGIGTSSPSRLLTVQATGTGNVANFQSNAGPNIAFTGTETSGRTYLLGEGLVTAGNFSIYDSTASAERLVVDSSGNLGLGVTPSAWSNINGGAFQFGTGYGSLYSYSNAPTFGCNVYYTGVHKYFANSQASAYQQYLGTHVWLVAPSGTAGNAVSFTQAMTLSNAGGLSVGTTSDAGAGNIRASGVFYAGDGSTSNNAFARAGGSGTGIYFPAANTIGFSTSASEVARIDSSGNLGLGVTPSGYYQIQTPVNYNGNGKGFNISSFAGGTSGNGIPYIGYNIRTTGTTGTYNYNASDYASAISFYDSIKFYITSSGTAGNAITFTQAMTLTNSGTLFVGQTSAVLNENGMGVSSSQTTSGCGVLNVTNTASSSADGSAPVVICKAMTTTSSSARFVQFYANTTATPMGGIVGNGASNVQFASISDAREKTNIAPINGSLNKILALKPSSFDWIKDGSHVNAGFIAQDVQTVFPEFVVENMANEGEEQRYGLTGGMNGGIIAHLVSAIQELKAEFDAYKATHP